MIKNKIMNALILSSFIASASPAFAENSQADLKSTATIENTCLISADNVNFGQVYAPLTNQGAQSQMKVLCSKSSSYTINLKYGGVYGTGTSLVDYSFAQSGTGTGGKSYKVFDHTGKEVGLLACLYNGSVTFYTAATAQLYGASIVNTTTPDVYNACNATAASPKPLQVQGGTAYNYGVMTGALKGDILAYKITIPGDITKVWNTGNNAYTSTGTGAEQVINMNAQIVPGNSSSLYPAQDMYTDTVTAVIAY